MQLLQNLKVKVNSHPSHPSHPSNSDIFTLPHTFPNTFPQASPSPNAPESVSLTDFSAPNSAITGNVESGGVTVNNAKNFDPAPPEFKKGDRVLINCPGLTGVHGKVGTIEDFALYQEQLRLALVRIPGQKQLANAQLTWLRPAPPEDET